MQGARTRVGEYGAVRVVAVFRLLRCLGGRDIVYLLVDGRNRGYKNVTARGVTRGVWRHSTGWFGGKPLIGRWGTNSNRSRHPCTFGNALRRPIGIALFVDDVQSPAVGLADLAWYQET